MPLFAININAFAAEAIETLDDNTVLISINPEEPEELFRLKLDRNNPNILTVRFADVTKEHNYRGYIIRPISKETTLQILDFIEKNKDKNFIIHCAAGISRSAAVAQFISEAYGHGLKPNFWNVSHPNNYVLYMLRTKGEYKH